MRAAFYNRSLPWLSLFSRVLNDETRGGISFSHNKHLIDTGRFERNSSEPPFPVPDCIPPSVAEFPDDLFTTEQRLHGGILVHVLIVIYVSIMLAIVCDRYFVPSLRLISKHFNVPPDIAGATFMAVGASSPELFSSVIGCFVTKGDIGVGTVVGSAVFNILAVTGVSGIAVGTTVVRVDWYPVTRDCCVYILTVASLAFVIHDNLVTWLEAASLLFMFVCYIILLYFNESIHRQAMKMLKIARSWWHREHHYLLTNMKTSPVNETTHLTVSQNGYCYGYEKDSACLRSSQEYSSLSYSGSTEILSDVTLSSSSNDCSAICKSDTEDTGICRSTKYDDKEEFVKTAEFSLVTPPDSIRKKIEWVLMWPANVLFYITIPNCSKERSLKWFPFTFLSSVLWLGLLSYMAFWMVATIGYTFGIPDTISGITILAAGTSVPELVASVIVVKSGLANMAISNLIGSNIFDILFCLGLPWLIKALLNSETRSLVINSSALTYTTLILLLAVVLFYLSLVILKWKLGYRVGITAVCMYVIFLILASLYENNTFGDFNPPTC